MAFVLDEVKDDPEFKQFIADTTRSAIETATSELSANNDKLIGEKRKMQGLVEKFEGFDMDAAEKAMKFMSSDENGRLLAEGKFDEVLQKHTEKVTSEYDEKVTTLTGERDTFKVERDTAVTRFERTMVDSELRRTAVKSGVLADALDDVMARGAAVFSYGEDGSVEARTKEGELLRDKEGKIVTPESWLKGLPRHYWPGSEGVGANGGKNKLSDLDVKIADAAAAGDQQLYRKLRRQQMAEKKK